MFRELTPLETYEELSQKGDAVLIDCRSPAEWHFTGTPDLSKIGKKPLLAAISDESGRPNPDFLDQVKALVEPATSIYVICRVGVRSANACRMLADAGYGSLVNVIEGFEGRGDENGHRNNVEGWKFHGLPWTQS
ncbi:MAG: rhodanese-like domain-containing protein [Pseudomonadota bacterium]|nr:rhodanese-like domain-containing protein [Pseudomonadota bacterium]